MSLVPVNYYVSTLFDHLQTYCKHSILSILVRAQAADFSHLLLLLHFALDNLLREEVDEYNQGRAHGNAARVDPSWEVIMVANTFVS